MELVMLGTGTPVADPDRSGPSLAIVTGGRAIIVDAGPGVVRRAAASAQQGYSELEAKNLDFALLTHLHSDHTVGLPDLAYTPWVLERVVPLTLLGPPGTERMANLLAATYEADIDYRIEFEPNNTTGSAIAATDIDIGDSDLLPVYEGEDLTIEAIPVMHGAWNHAFGYRFRTADRTIVVSGDTAPTDTIVDAATNADILVHEVYSYEKFLTREPEWQDYHSRHHTSTRELAEIAKRAQPGLLVLYHQLFWGATDDDLVREIREAGYDGPVISASDLDVF